MKEGDHIIAIGLGIEFCVIMLLGTYAGYYYDRKWDTLPYFTLIGAFCSFGLGFYALVFSALKISEVIKLPKNKTSKKNKIKRNKK